MVLSSMASNNKMNEFFYSAINSVFVSMMPSDEASYLARALVSKQSKQQLLDFLQSPIIVINGENGVLVDNKFIKRRLLEKQQFDILANLKSAKIVICNSNNISIKGLDVIYLMGNTVRVISPDDEDVAKNEIFLAKDNKVITTINANIEFSIGNSFKNLMHTSLGKVKNTRIINATQSCEIPNVPTYQSTKGYEKNVN